MHILALCNELCGLEKKYNYDVIILFITLSNIMLILTVFAEFKISNLYPQVAGFFNRRSNVRCRMHSRDHLWCCRESVRHIESKNCWPAAISCCHNETTTWWVSQLRDIHMKLLVLTAQCFVKLIFTARPHCIAMQSAVIPTAIPSVCPSVRPSVCLSVRPSHAGTLSRRMNIGLRGLHCEVAKTL